MWARLVHIGVVMAITFCHGGAEALTAQSGASLAKIRPMRTLENVQITDLSVDIDSQDAAFDERQFLSSERPRCSGVEMRITSRRDNLLGIGKLSWWTSKVEGSGHWPNINRYPTIRDHVMSRGLPQILDVNFNLDSSSSRWFANERKFLSGIEEDVGTQLPLGIPISAPHQSIGLLPKKDGGEAENYRGGGENQRPEGNPKFIMSRKEAVERAEPLWPAIAAFILMIAPGLGVVLGCRNSRLLTAFGCGIQLAWVACIIGIAIMVGMG